jgi:hypothetical protein
LTIKRVHEDHQRTELTTVCKCPEGEECHSCRRGYEYGENVACFQWCDGKLGDEERTNKDKRFACKFLASFELTNCKLGFESALASSAQLVQRAEQEEKEGTLRPMDAKRKHRARVWEEENTKEQARREEEAQQKWEAEEKAKREAVLKQQQEEEERRMREQLAREARAAERAKQEEEEKAAEEALELEREQERQRLKKEAKEEEKREMDERARSMGEEREKISRAAQVERDAGAKQETDRLEADQALAAAAEAEAALEEEDYGDESDGLDSPEEQAKRQARQKLRREAAEKARKDAEEKMEKVVEEQERASEEQRVKETEEEDRRVAQQVQQVEAQAQQVGERADAHPTLTTAGATGEDNSARGVQMRNLRERLGKAAAMAQAGKAGKASAPVSGEAQIRQKMAAGATARAAAAKAAAAEGGGGSAAAEAAGVAAAATAATTAAAAAAVEEDGEDEEEKKKKLKGAMKRSLAARLAKRKAGKAAAAAAAAAGGAGSASEVDAAGAAGAGERAVVERVKRQAEEIKQAEEAALRRAKLTMSKATSMPHRLVSDALSVTAAAGRTSADTVYKLTGADSKNPTQQAQTLLQKAAHEAVLQAAVALEIEAQIQAGEAASTDTQSLKEALAVTQSKVAAAKETVRLAAKWSVQLEDNVSAGVGGTAGAAGKVKAKEMPLLLKQRVEIVAASVRGDAEAAIAAITAAVAGAKVVSGEVVGGGGGASAGGAVKVAVNPQFEAAQALHKAHIDKLHGRTPEENATTDGRGANGSTAGVGAGGVVGLEVVVDAAGGSAGVGVGVPGAVKLQVPVSVDGKEMLVTIENGQTPEAVSSEEC